MLESVIVGVCLFAVVVTAVCISRVTWGLEAIQTQIASVAGD